MKNDALDRFLRCQETRPLWVVPDWLYHLVRGTAACMLGSPCNGGPWGTYMRANDRTYELSSPSQLTAQKHILLSNQMGYFPR